MDKTEPLLSSHSRSVAAGRVGQLFARNKPTPFLLLVHGELCHLWEPPAPPVLRRVIAVHETTYAMVSKAGILLRKGICCGLQPPDTAMQPVVQHMEGAKFLIPV